MRKSLFAGVTLVALGLALEANAADLNVEAVKAPAPALIWNWAGLYIGAHVGGAWGTTDFSDPFGTSVFGDKVRTPGFLGGAQVGYNWQTPGSSWVFGVEADISGFESDGTNTCFAASALTINATCRVRPQLAGTFTGRIGYAVGASGHTLIYGKGGVAWVNDQIDMALNAGGAPGFSTSNSQTVTLRGGTFGVGVEQALTSAWSLKVEYDYLGLVGKNVANLGAVSFLSTPPFDIVGNVPPGTSGVLQKLQEVKVGVNYKWGADPSAPGWSAVAPMAYPVKARPMTPVVGWEFEGGGRYFGSWGQFHKDLGFFTTSGLPSISNVSRTTYDDLQTNSGEFFGRVETPWNLFVKGFIGGGSTGNGHMNDEDFVLPLGGLLGAYSNTLSSNVTGKITYGAIDGGIDFLRGPGYKVGVFGGYFALDQAMNAFGCTPVAFVNCIPSVPTSGSAIITENDKWRAARIGVAGEAMLTDRVKLSGEVAYLPWVHFDGVDQHFFGNFGMLAENFPESGNGRGVQVEALVSYYLTPQWSVGVGGRYWGIWTTSGQMNCTFGASGLCGATPTPPQFFKAQVEQAGALVQTSYKFSTP